MKTKHTPAANRKNGFTARINYGVALILIGIYGLLVSRTIWKNLPDWSAFNLYNWRNRRSRIWDVLLENEGELTFFILVGGIILCFIFWLMFASKLAVVRLRWFRNAKYFIPLLCLLYFFFFYGFYFEKLPNEIAIPVYIAAALIAIIHFGGVYLISQNKLKSRKFYTINNINVFILFGVLHYLYPSKYIWYLFWMILVPVIILYFKNLILISIEYIKETGIYQRWFTTSHEGVTARWGGFNSFFKKDIGAWFFKNRNRIWFSAESTIFYGRTLFENDFQFRGRNIGVKNQWHHILVAGTRGGKSVDVIYTNVLNYSGGIIALDPKGEITQVVWKRRSKQRPFFVIDPFNVVIGKRNSGVTLRNSHWNPLDEIDVEHIEAREHIKTLAEACIEKSDNEKGNTAHFRETAQIVLRGVIAYVLSDPFLKDEQRHLGTVFNFIKYGEAEPTEFSPLKIDAFIKTALTTNNAVNGAAKEAASVLTTAGAKAEKGAILTTLTRGIDWINSPSIQKIICHKSDFSLADAKTKEASIFLILPEEHLEKFSRLTASFFTTGLNKCSTHVTPQPKGSKRRVLFLMEEFSKLGYFAPAARKITIAASSHIKFWFILQNIEQLTTNYKNASDFLGSSDLQIFALDKKDNKTANYISEILGSYTLKAKEGERTYKLMEAVEVATFLDVGTKNQLIIPRQGHPLKLKRVPFFKLFKRSQYGKNTY